jgi:hypothetical protein
MRYIRVAARHGEIQADPEEHPKLDPLVKNGTPTLKLNLPNLAATETTLRYNSRASVGVVRSASDNFDSASGHVPQGLAMPIGYHPIFANWVEPIEYVT